MRVLVCGGREYTNRKYIYTFLDAQHLEYNFDILVEGDAIGVDRIAGDWAGSRGVDLIKCPANWNKYGDSAGPRRNKFMLDLFQPNIVIAFDGGTGTNDMIKRTINIRGESILFIDAKEGTGF